MFFLTLNFISLLYLAWNLADIYSSHSRRESSNKYRDIIEKGPVLDREFWFQHFISCFLMIMSNGLRHSNCQLQSTAFDTWNDLKKVSKTIKKAKVGCFKLFLEF